MKIIISIILIIQFTITAVAQYSAENISPVQETPRLHYYTIEKFLSEQKKYKTIFDSRIFLDQYQSLLTINKKKEFYPVVVMDSRFISHSMPVSFGAQNYVWVSKHENLVQQITGDIISGVASGLLNSKHRYFNNNNKGYYTPAGLKY
ncbi:MAG: hypothetical protein ABIO04_08470 [Ferruginibacter sp.]